MSDDIKSKIQKLLAMRVDRGATEDEAETAMRIAAGLAAKHGIDLDSLMPAGTKRKPTIAEKRVRDPMTWTQMFTARAAAMLYGVECELYGEGKRGFQFTGREENVELAQDTMFWLFRQVEEIYKEVLPKGLSEKERGEFRKTFKPACAERVYERARRIMWDLQYNQESAKQSTGQNALAVETHFKTLRQEINDYWHEKFKPTPDQIKRAQEYAEKQRKWREDHPEEAAKQDKEDERDRKREERNAAKRKGRRKREMPYGSGTSAGRIAGDRVKLRKDVK